MTLKIGLATHHVPGVRRIPILEGFVCITLSKKGGDTSCCGQVESVCVSGVRSIHLERSPCFVVSTSAHRNCGQPHRRTCWCEAWSSWRSWYVSFRRYDYWASWIISLRVTNRRRQRMSTWPVWRPPTRARAHHRRRRQWWWSPRRRR
jgi:hypothetical protein